MYDKHVSIEGNKYTIFSEVIDGVELFGWYPDAAGRNHTGTMYNGKPYSVPRAEYLSYEKVIDALATHLSYYHGIRRSTSQEAFK